MLVKKGWTNKQIQQLRRRRDVEYWKKLINGNNIPHAHGSLFYLDFPGTLGGKN